MNEKSFILGVAIGGGLVYGFILRRIAKSAPKTRRQKFFFFVGHLIAKLGGK